MAETVTYMSKKQRSRISKYGRRTRQQIYLLLEQNTDREKPL